MLDQLKTSLWKHFGGSIDMLGNAIAMWPEDQWNANKRFFYMAYHCLVFLDYYLTIPPNGFQAPLPYTLTDEEPNGRQMPSTMWCPDRIYSKQELLDWLRLSREKCRHVISGLTEEKLNEPWISGTGVDLDLASGGALHYSVLDILLYNMKHVQHHAAQLNLMLRQTIHDAPDYVSMAEDGL